MYANLKNKQLTINNYRFENSTTTHIIDLIEQYKKSSNECLSAYVGNIEIEQCLNLLISLIENHKNGFIK